MENTHTREHLRELQSLPLYLKVRLTKQRIREWVNHYGEDGVYVSFSGGKDSTVLLHLVREEYEDVPGVFCDTGLEFPEIRDFVKTFDNITWLKPKKNFRQVVHDYGYPVVSKDVAQCVFDVAVQSRVNNCDKRDTKQWNRVFNPNSKYAKRYPQYTRAKYDFLNDAPFKISHMCCDVMKKRPAKHYEKSTHRVPILATMAVESRLRTTVWMKEGCNAFDTARPKSKPMSFWTEQDVLRYLVEYNVPYCEVYGDIKVKLKNQVDGQMSIYDLTNLSTEGEVLETTGAKRTGCIFCMFGCHLEKEPNRFQRLKETHPRQYEYCIQGGQWVDGQWMPSNEGLGLWRVLDTIGVKY